MSAVTGVLHLAEPAAPFHARPPTVVDCSVVAGLLFEEPWMAQAEASLLGRDLKAPYLMQSEIAHVALKKHRKGFEQVARSGLARFAGMQLALLPVEPESVFELARRYEISGYDACYLWLASHLQCPLATFDDRLAAAARSHLGSLP